MILHSMTATFGKLEHETLTLQPGLNIIEAPNEWGKSTWCAFLVAMLYGVDTKAKSKKTALADKERYAPWSGSPMAGRLELTWQGRRITIERSTKSRIPLGKFVAYETETGLTVPELNADNCGQMLLGVERSVFLRAGFIRLNEMPVTQDESLRARLNALVTTGDESGDGERLGKALRELKNKCRYKKTGLLPQLEQEQAELEEKCREMDQLAEQTEKLSQRRQEVAAWLEDLSNHRDHLQYNAAQSDEEKVALARQQRHDAVERLEEADGVCNALPTREACQQLLHRSVQLRECCLALQMEEQMLPPVPRVPEVPDWAWEEDPAASAAADLETQQLLDRSRKKIGLAWVLYGVFAAALMGLAAYFAPEWIWYAAAAAAVTFLGVLIWSLLRNRKLCRQLDQLYNRYHGLSPDQWETEAQNLVEQIRDYSTKRQSAERARAGYVQRAAELEGEILTFTGGKPLEDCLAYWKDAVEAWAAYGDAQREAIRADNYWKTLQSMAKVAQAPRKADALTYTEGETARLISDANGELTLLDSQLSRYRGRMEVLGNRETVRRDLNRLNTRIRQLEEWDSALLLAQKTLLEASLELQRRFAPQIARRAQEHMAAFTGGRYRQLRLGEDLELQAGADSEDTLREALWRSDGTVDQLYLALRLAVAETLTADAPLVLDDALVRFDDDRLKATLDALQNEAKTKQVILFTCQSREKRLL